MPLKTQFTKCKVTGQKIPVIFNFGKMPIANNFSKKVDKKNLYEMKIAFNESNGSLSLSRSKESASLITSRAMQLGIYSINLGTKLGQRLHTGHMLILPLIPIIITISQCSDKLWNSSTESAEISDVQTQVTNC